MSQKDVQDTGAANLEGGTNIEGRSQAYESDCEGYGEGIPLCGRVTDDCPN